MGSGTFENVQHGKASKYCDIRSRAIPVETGIKLKINHLLNFQKVHDLTMVGMNFILESITCDKLSEFENFMIICN